MEIEAKKFDAQLWNQYEEAVKGFSEILAKAGQRPLEIPGA